MNAKRFLWALLPVAAALSLHSCSEDDDTVSGVKPQKSTTIPYTVTVGGDDVTRATVASNNSTLLFAAGDKLYISGENISGVLTLTEGEGTASGTFTGTLTYPTNGAPTDNSELTATLVGVENIGVQISDDKVTGIDYGTGICTSVNDAVKQYSLLTGTSTFGSHSFTLQQQTAFLNFTIDFTYDDDTPANTTVPVSVTNVGGNDRSGTMTTTTSGGKVVGTFVVPVAMQTLTSYSCATVGGNPAYHFGYTTANSVITSYVTLTGQVYNINRSTMSLYRLKNMINASDSRYTDFYGWYVDYDGYLYSSNTYIALRVIGRVAYMLTTDIDSDIEGSRILVLARRDVGDYRWKINTTAGDGGYGDSGYKFTKEHANSTYPAANAAWNSSTPRPEYVSEWFLPSRTQWIWVKNRWDGDRQSILPTTSYYYWSSTEIDTDGSSSGIKGAYLCYKMYGSGTWNSHYSKTDSYTVRPMFAY